MDIGYGGCGRVNVCVGEGGGRIPSALKGVISRSNAVYQGQCVGVRGQRPCKEVIAVFSKTWQTSERKYGMVVKRDVRIAMSDGTEINADIFLPDGPGKFPALLGLSPCPLAPPDVADKACTSVYLDDAAAWTGEGWRLS